MPSNSYKLSPIQGNKEQTGHTIEVKADLPHDNQDSAAADHAYELSHNQTEEQADKELDITKLPACLQEEFEDLDLPVNSKFYKFAKKVAEKLQKFWNSKVLQIVGYLFLFCLFGVYVGFCVNNFLRKRDTASGDEYESNIRVLWMAAIVFLLALVSVVKNFCRLQLNSVGVKVSQVTDRLAGKFGDKLNILLLIAQLLVMLAVVIWVAITSPENLISALGLIALLLIALLCCRNVAMIDWHPIIGGLMLQLVFAILVLRTVAGFTVFNFIGDRVSEFLRHCDAGASFVFGANFREHFFAFSVLPVIIFFSSFISILFHLGVVQVVIEKIGTVMKFFMRTGAAETTTAAANIFIGQTEAPLLIAPYLKAMTNSEIHSVMTSGFATIAGGVMAAYIGMGVSAKHLIGASVMSAPAALAVSKLMYPETKKAIIVAANIRRIKLEKFSNLVEAAGAGAISAMKLVGAIAANLIAFTSLLQFLNTSLTWFGHRAGFELDITFELLSSFLFWPISFLMGVPLEDCRPVAQLAGIKTFINEFVAYERFAKMVANYPILMNATLNGTHPYHWSGNDIVVEAVGQTIVGGTILHEKSRIIATYALCGFANLSSIGIQIGGLAAIAPQRRKDIVSCVITAMIAGNIACFMTACIAGLLYQA